MSSLVGLMSLGDVERGLELGCLAGELSTIANVVDALEMPVLAAVLDDRGEQIQDIAVDVILRAAAERGLAQLMAATGQQIGELGAEEIDEGLLRIAASEIAAERSTELAEAGADLADEMVEAGVADVTAGAAELGAADAMDEED
jgi:hypothetical protein